MKNSKRVVCSLQSRRGGEQLSESAGAEQGPVRVPRGVCAALSVCCRHGELKTYLHCTRVCGKDREVDCRGKAIVRTPGTEHVCVCVFVYLVVN